MIRAVDAKRDARAVCRIYNHYVTETTVTYEIDPVDEQEMEGRIGEITAGKGLPYLVYEDEESEEVVGYCYAAPWGTRAAFLYTVEVSVYVRKDYVGKKVGLLLYETLLEQLRTQGVHAVVAAISLPNPGSVAVTERLGFRKVGHLNEVGWKFGKWLDLGFWQLNF